MLTDKDKAYIQRNINNRTPLEMSLYIEKNVVLIQEYIKSLTDYEPSAELRSNPDWRLKSSEFTPDELVYFEDMYKNYRTQMGDILPTEDRQLIQVVELEIFMHRNKKARKKVEEDLLNVERRIEAENQKFDKDIDKIINDEKHAASLRAAVPALSREYNEYNNKHSSLLKDLKSTRHQRIQELTDSKTNILGLLKKLNDEDFKRKQAIELELMKESTRKEKAKLSKLHTFANGEVSLPLLNSETVSKIEKSDSV